MIFLSLFSLFYNIEMEGTVRFPHRRSLPRSAAGWEMYIDTGTGPYRLRFPSEIPEERRIPYPSQDHQGKPKITHKTANPGNNLGACGLGAFFRSGATRF